MDERAKIKSEINIDRRSYIKKVLDGAIGGSLLLVIPASSLRIAEQISGTSGEKGLFTAEKKFAFVADITACIGCGFCCLADKREYFVMRNGKRTPDLNCIRASLRLPCAFFILDVTFELLEVYSLGYMATSHWDSLHSLLWGPLYNSYWVWQVMIFAGVPLVLPGYLTLAKPGDTLVEILAPATATMVLLHVLLMRWNVVIGGPMMSKSERGLVFFRPEWPAREGILLSMVIMALPVVVLYLLGKIFLFWRDESTSATQVSSKG